MYEEIIQKAKIRVKPLIVPTVRDEVWKGVFGSYPHAFQSEIPKIIEAMRKSGGGAILLNLPTGLGKTRALITHALLKGTSVIIVYPNNTLLNDQARQIRSDVKASGSSHEIVEIDAYHLSEYMSENETRDFARKGRAIYSLLATGIGSLASPKIVLTNPDMWSLLLHGKPAMSQLSIAQILQYYPVVCFDEMHSYDVKQLCSIIHGARLLQEHAPIIYIFSSATIDEQIKKMMKIFPNYEEEEIEKQINFSQEFEIMDSRPVLAPLMLLVEHVGDWQAAKWVLQEENLSTIRQMAAENGCLLIFDSIPETMSVYRSLSEIEGNDRVGLVIGAVEPSNRKSEMEKNTVVGNTTIRVGIDFSRENAKRNAVVYARTSFDAIQGLGRMGRGEERNTFAILLAPAETTRFLNEEIQYPQEGISRVEVGELMRYAFDEREKFLSYIEMYAHIEAIHMQKVVGINAAKLIQELFGKDVEVAFNEYKNFKKKELLDELTLFRQGEPFQIAVMDDLFRQKGLFEFYTADVFRVLKFGEIHPMKWDEYWKELSQRCHGCEKQAQKFRFNLEERINSGDVVGVCRVSNWNSEPRKVHFCNYTRILNPNFLKNQLLNDKGWELVKKKSMPNHILAVYNRICERMREQQRTFIIFSRNEIRKPPHLFKTYPVDERPGLAVAFGHNAFLIHSMVGNQSYYIS